LQVVIANHFRWSSPRAALFEKWRRIELEELFLTLIIALPLPEPEAQQLGHALVGSYTAK
jgi:hypothetical protein